MPVAYAVVSPNASYRVSYVALPVYVSFFFIRISPYSIAVERMSNGSETKSCDFQVPSLLPAAAAAAAAATRGLCFTNAFVPIGETRCSNQ